MGGWALGIAGVQTGVFTEGWGRLTFASSSLMAAAFLAFARVFPETSAWPGRALLSAAWANGAAFALLSLTTPLVAFDISYGPAGIKRNAGPLYPLLTAYILMCATSAFGLLARKWSTTRGLARVQLQYLGTGVLIFTLGATTTNLLIPAVSADSRYSTLGPYFTLPLVILAGHAIIRHRLMDLRIVIHRGVAYIAFASLLSAGIIALGKLLISSSISRGLTLPFEAATLVAVGLLMFTLPVQRLLSAIIDPYIFRGRIDHASLLRSATHRLTGLKQPSELAVEIHQMLSKAFAPEAFVMLAPLGASDRHETLLKQPDQPSLFAETAEFATFVRLLDGPGVAVLTAIPAGARGSIKQALVEAGFELLISLGRRGQQLGVILLGRRRSREAYFAADLVFLESLTELASIALDNALLYRHRIEMLEYSNRLLEALDSAVVAVDSSARLTSFNPAAQELLGLRDEDRGHSIDCLPSEIGWAFVFALAGIQGLDQVEVTIDHHERGPTPVILSTVVLHGDQEETTGALAIATDVSALKKLELDQRRVEHLAVMARFYAGIAHEIRSPLASISNFVAMLPDRFDDSEYRETAGRLLPNEVARIVRLAERLRLMAPSEGGKQSIVSISPLLRDIISIHSSRAEERGVRLLLACGDSLPKILGDSEQLIQLFVNLLNNALDAMSGSGTITIEARTTTHGQPPAPAVGVRIIDEGSGVPLSMRAKIFEPFFTTKPQGSGLGLAICKEIADFHGAVLALIPRNDRSGTIAQVIFSGVSPNTDTDDDAMIETPMKPPTLLHSRPVRP